MLAAWIAVGSDERERASGASVFQFGAQGKIEAVTGFWDPSAAAAK